MSEDLFALLALVIAAALISPTIVFTAFWYSNRDMSIWKSAAAAYFIILAGLGIAALREFYAGAAMILLSNILVGYGHLRLLEVVKYIHYVTPRRRQAVLILAAYAAVLVFILSYANTYQNRAAASSFFITGVSVWTLWVIVNSDVRTTAAGSILMGVFAAGNTFFAFMRAQSATFTINVPYLQFDLWDPLFFAWVIVAMFLVSIGIFLSGNAQIAKKTQKDLDQQKKLAASLDTALTEQRELKKMIYHELSRPISALTVLIETAKAKQNGMEPPTVDKIHYLTRNASRYLETIVEHDDIEAILERPSFEIVSLRRLVFDIQQQTQIELYSDDNLDEVFVSIDPLLIDIALGNLIENAFKFGRSVDRVVAQLRLDHAQVHFDIVDPGPGIPDAETSRVFDKFHPIESSGGSDQNGMGLGLYLVKKISELHRGNCVVYKATPSTLRFTLPIEKGR